MKKYFFLLIFISFSGFAQKKPNVIIILADDMGYGDIEAINKNSKIPTPNLNKLVNRGLNFTDAHSNSAVCTPTRYGILTGEYAYRSSLKRGVLTGFDPPLIKDKATLGNLFKNAGYSTACIGKWHLGLGWQKKDETKPLITGDVWSKMSSSNVDFYKSLSHGPKELGFDFSYIIPSSLDIAPYFYIENGRVTQPKHSYKPKFSDGLSNGGWYREGDTAEDFVHENVLDNITDQSVTFIKENQKNPFFLYLPLTAPHSPWLPSKEFKGKSGAGYYGDFMMMVDHQVGKIMAQLKESDIEENTLIIFTSDNGSNWSPEEIARFSHEANIGRSGKKSDAWDGGHRVPFVAYWPAVIKEKRETSSIVCTTDFMDTFAVMLSQKEIKPIDSYSFYSELLGKGKTERPFVIHHSIEGYFAIRKGDWKYVEAKGSGGWTLNEKNATEKGLTYGQLYNIKLDPLEKTNLIKNKLNVYNELNTLLQRAKFFTER